MAFQIHKFSIAFFGYFYLAFACWTWRVEPQFCNSQTRTCQTSNLIMFLLVRLNKKTPPIWLRMSTATEPRHTEEEEDFHPTLLFLSTDDNREYRLRFRIGVPQLTVGPVLTNDEILIVIDHPYVSISNGVVALQLPP